MDDTMTRFALSWILFTFNVYYAATTTTTTTPTTTTTNTPIPTNPVGSSSGLGDIPKAVITIVVLAVILGIAIVIARLATKCYERNEIRDDASDISEHTRDLLKATLTVAKFKSTVNKSKVVKDREQMRQKASRKYAKIWIANTRKKRKLRAEAVTMKWTSHTKERPSRPSLVSPFGVKNVNGNAKNDINGVQSNQTQNESSKAPPPVEIKVINETEKPKPKAKGTEGKFATRFPAVLKKQLAIPAPHPDDPKSDILDTPKKTANTNSTQEPDTDKPGTAPTNAKSFAETNTSQTPAPTEREKSMVTPKHVAVEVDNKPITAKSQAMRPVSAKPKLIRPSSTEKKAGARPGTAKRQSTPKNQPATKQKSTAKNKGQPK